MTETELHPIFKDCCAKERMRYAITEPFQCGKYICATDGRILVRMKGRIEPSDSRATPPANDIFTGWAGSGEFVELPSVKPTMKKCPECEGSGTERKSCDKCEGTGYVDCPRCGGEDDCDDCGGNGYVENTDKKCPECNGAKEVVDETALVYLGDVGLSYRYVAMLLRHGVTQVELDQNKVTRPVRFCIGEIEGMLMPRNKN